jgi:hypothetical protein
MSDYGCFPLWWAEDNSVGNIDPTTLPLKEETIHSLSNWEESYNKQINWDDPSSSLDLSDDEIEDFEKHGISLWNQLREELLLEYEVLYFSRRLNKLLLKPSELDPLNS